VYIIDIYVKSSSLSYAFYIFYIFPEDFVVILLSRCDNIYYDFYKRIKQEQLSVFIITVINKSSIFSIKKALPFTAAFHVNILII